MRYAVAGLLDDVVDVYDQTKTTLFGRAFEKTVDGKVALGPPLNKFIDVFTTAGLVPAANATICTPNGRIFTIQAEASGLSQISLFEIDFETGAHVYVGKIQIAIPDVAATTTIFRSIKVLDGAGVTGWKICITTTGSVLINGGTFIVNNIDRADFLPVGFPTILFATGNNQKAVYFAQDPLATGAGHLQIASAGSALDATAQRLYVHNGVSATHQYYVFDLSISPTYQTFAITGDQASNTILQPGHTFVSGDPIVFTSLTGGAGLTVGTTYFVGGVVPGVSYFVSATTGGAAINYTTDITAGFVGRAFGTSGSNFLFKTGNLPALAGVLLLTDSEDYAEPVDTGNPTVDGFPCVFLATTTNLYLGRLSELTSGALTWPSLVTVNLLGGPNQITAPTPLAATWSTVMNRALYTVGSVIVMKRFANNTIDLIFGGTSNKYLEGITTEAVELQPAGPITSLDVENGWIFITNAIAGQRGIMAADIYSDSFFDYSYIVTKVFSTPQAVYKFLTTTDALYDFTGSLSIFYKTSGFSDPGTGWVPMPFAEDLTFLAAGQQVQLKIQFSTVALDTSIPAQLCEVFLGYDSLVDSSDYWELSRDDSDNGNPSRSAFRLKQTYPGPVPTLFYRALDLTNVTLVTHNTIANNDRFSYSSDNGVTWNPIGVVPNTIGTLVRYQFLTPPGVDIRPSLKEE